MNGKSEMQHEQDEQAAEEKVQEMIPTKEIIERVNNPPPTREDIEHKQQIIFKIQKYQDSGRFGHIVKTQLKFDQPYDELSEMHIENLENMLSRIRIHLDNKNLDKFYDSMLKGGAMVYEEVVSPFYDIYGFADMITSNDEFMCCWERFKIENNFPSVDSTSQMLFMIAQTTLVAHHMAQQYEPVEPKSEMEGPSHSVDEVIASIENGDNTQLSTIDENKELVIKDDTTSKDEDIPLANVKVGEHF